MTIYVGARKRQTYRLSDMAARTDLDLTSGLTLQLVYRFANDDTAKVDGTIDDATDTVTFLTPADSIFTLERRGPSVRAVRIKEDSGVDDLTDPITEKVELHPVGTPTEIDAIT